MNIYYFYFFAFLVFWAGQRFVYKNYLQNATIPSKLFGSEIFPLIARYTVPTGYTPGRSLGKGSQCFIQDPPAWLLVSCRQNNIPFEVPNIRIKTLNANYRLTDVLI